MLDHELSKRFAPYSHITDIFEIFVKYYRKKFNTVLKLHLCTLYIKMKWFMNFTAMRNII